MRSNSLHPKIFDTLVISSFPKIIIPDATFSFPKIILPQSLFSFLCTYLFYSSLILVSTSKTLVKLRWREHQSKHVHLVQGRTLFFANILFPQVLKKELSRYLILENNQNSSAVIFATPFTDCFFHQAAHSN